MEQLNSYLTNNKEDFNRPQQFYWQLSSKKVSSDGVTDNRAIPAAVPLG